MGGGDSQNGSLEGISLDKTVLLFNVSSILQLEIYLTALFFSLYHLRAIASFDYVMQLFLSQMQNRPGCIRPLSLCTLKHYTYESGIGTLAGVAQNIL